MLLPVILSGCYTLAEPSFDPGDSRAVLSAIVRRGIVATDPVPGRTACVDPDVVGNSVYLTARMPDEDQARDVYVHTYRARDWEASSEEVDACQAEYAAVHPGAQASAQSVASTVVSWYSPVWVAKWPVSTSCTHGMCLPSAA